MQISKTQHGLFRTVLAIFLVVVLGAAGIQAGQATPAPSDPADGQPKQSVELLIEQLGDRDFFVRERAQAQLAEMGFEAFDALNAAITHDDLEIATRARYLLRLMKIDWVRENDPPEVKEALKDYQLQSASGKVRRMGMLARLPGLIGIPALCRLVRFEEPIPSKQAALIVMDYRGGKLLPSEALADAVRAGLKTSRRPTAEWLRTWLAFRDDPRQALADWGRLVEQEQGLLERSAADTQPEMIAALVRFEVDWWNKLGDAAQAQVAMRRLIDLEKGNTASLSDLVAYLVEQEAWPVLDALVERFPAQFQADAKLRYDLAEAYVKQGDLSRAEQTAAEALQLNPGDSTTQLSKHRGIARVLQARRLYSWAEKEYRYLLNRNPGDRDALTALVTCLAEQKQWKAIVELETEDTLQNRFAQEVLLLYLLAQAQSELGEKEAAEATVETARKLNPLDWKNHWMAAIVLQQRGLFEWARWEYEYVIEKADAEDEVRLRALYGFAEMLHDQGENLPAAEALLEIVDIFEKNGVTGDDGFTLAETQARANYFLACHHRDQGELEKQQEYLDKALEADSSEIDTLIACYRLPKPTEEYRAKIVRLIQAAADMLREQVEENPGLPMYYNQYAWLVGNTEGNIDEALSYSKKSLELRPDFGGYYDTLAHVYFYGKRDYENAVKYQTRAVELDPHSGLLKRQFDVFKKAWEEEQKEDKGMEEPARE